GLTPDGRRILAGPHNRVPLRPSRKRVGHGPFYDLLQSHASSPPGSVSPTPTSSSSSRSSRILTASAFPTAHSRRRARSLASSGVMIVSAGPSADTTMRTWPLCVGCTTKLVSYTLVTAPSRLGQQLPQNHQRLVQSVRMRFIIGVLRMVVHHSCSVNGVHN